MTLADPKPAKRIKDRHAFVLFHDQNPECVSCGHGREIQAHHLIGRGQGGDDLLANLVALCGECHLALHGQPYTSFGVRIDAYHVHHALAAYIRSEPEQYAALYLSAKLGPEAAEDFVQRLEA